MQRYRTKSDVKIKDVIVFDNSLGFIEEIPKIKVIGEIIANDSSNDNVLVAFKINGEDTPLEKEIPYFLAQ